MNPFEPSDENQDARFYTPPSLEQEDKIQVFDETVDLILKEAQDAMKKWPSYNSAHEGYGVLMEEVDELFDHVKTKQSKRDLVAMRKECIQIAAVALRFAAEICNEEVGRK